MSAGLSGTGLGQFRGLVSVMDYYQQNIQAYQNNQGAAQVAGGLRGLLPPYGIATYNPLPITPTEPEEFRWLRRRVEEVMLNL